MKKRAQRRHKPKAGAGGKRAATGDTRRILSAAVGMLQAGQLSRARPLFEQVLQREPANADALHFFGLYWFHAGDPEQARRLIERAISRKPRVAPYHDNLGKVLEFQGDLEEALRAYLEADDLEPNVADRRFNMGVVLQQMRRHAEAEQRFREAIRLDSKDPDYHFNLGIALKDQGRHADAVSAYRNAVSLNPRSAKFKNNLGNALLLMGDAAGAVEVFRRAVSRSPSNANLHNNLGNALRQLGELDAAAGSFRRALEIDPALMSAHQNLGNVLVMSGRLEEAARVFLRAWNRFPKTSAFRRGFASAVRHLGIETHDRDIETAIQACMRAEDVNAQDLARVAAAQLRARLALDAARPGVPGAAGRALADDESALRLLKTCINVDPVLEGLLAGARSWLLDLAGGGLPDELLPFACALAQQCFANEFVFGESPRESRAVEALVSDLRAAAAAPDPVDPARLSSVMVGVALYRPLHALDFAERLRQRLENVTWPEALSALIEQALLAPLDEARLAPRIPAVGVISDPTSVAVKEQYESHPYPRWLQVPRREPETYGKYLRRLVENFEPPGWLDGKARVLVAGCGTGFEAIGAATNRECSQVIGVDLSRPSLAYAVRMAEKLGVDNVEFFQADVLDLPSTGRLYDVVESSGVLHHLADPLAGWKTLVDCLKPGGIMKVGLYSERARQSVVAARALARAQGLRPDPEGIRSLRSMIFNADRDDPIVELKQSEDLYTMSACRDLLFHVCEHRFTLDQISDCLQRLGLRFLAFELPFSFMRSRFREVNGGASAVGELEAWKRVEERYPETFAAMYVFWCQRPA